MMINLHQPTLLRILTYPTHVGVARGVTPRHCRGPGAVRQLDLHHGDRSTDARASAHVLYGDGALGSGGSGGRGWIWPTLGWSPLE